MTGRSGTVTGHMLAFCYPYIHLVRAGIGTPRSLLVTCFAENNPQSVILGY